MADQPDTNTTPKARQLLSRALGGVAILAVILLVFLLLFGAFERISLQAIAVNHGHFSRHVATLSDTMQSLVQSMATQIYYITSTTKLRTAEELTTYDRIYALREVGQYVSSSPMLQSIYVFNDARQMVFSTDELFFSTTYDRFGDKAALAMYLQRQADERGKLRYRTIVDEQQLPHPRPSYAFMLFETGGKGRILPGGIMLNLDPQFFRNRLLTFPGKNTLVLDRDGRLVAAQDAGLLAPAQAVWKQVLEALDAKGEGFIVHQFQGNSMLVFYAAVQAGEWVALRMLPYNEALPGLYGIRNGAALLLGLAIALFAIAAIYLFLRVYRPLSHMRKRLSSSGLPTMEPGTKPIDRLDHILESSLKLQQRNALRNMLAGAEADKTLLPPPPWLLTVLETANLSPFHEWQKSMRHNWLYLLQENRIILLHTQPSGEELLDLCNGLATQLSCRCYYAKEIGSEAALRDSYHALQELMLLRLFYPGQRVLHESLLQNHLDAEPFPTEEGSAVGSAIRSGDEDSMRLAFHRFVWRLRSQTAQSFFLALNRLLTQIQSMESVASSSLTLTSAEEMVRKAASIDAVYELARPAFVAVAAAQAQLRQQRVSALADRVVERVQQGYADPRLSAKQIADEMEMTPSYLRRQFYDAHQMSVSDYLNHVRIAKAKELLESTDLTVEAIAQQVGYENHKYMYVLFKKAVGMTPRAYSEGKKAR